MRIILFILLFVSQLSFAQVGNKNLFFRSPITAPESGFNWDNLQAQAPTTYSNSGTITVENKSFTNLNVGVNSGDNVYVTGSSNITFLNCYFGPSIRKGARLEGLTGTVRFVNCLFVSNEGGIEFKESSGNLQVDNCQFVNPWGARNCKGQSVQFAGGVTTNGSYIINSTMESFRGEGYTEDWISLYISSGTSSNPIRIANCYARGGGPSPSGGGFMTGDSGGEWQLVENNKLYNTGNYMLACSGGENITIQNNLGYQPSVPWINIAMYAYNVAAASCNNITVTSNGMFISNANYWYAPGGSESCGSIAGSSFTGIGNLENISLSDLGFPATIIDFVDEDRLWHLRDESVQFRDITGECTGSKPAQLHRPTSNAGADQDITISTATLSGSGSSSTNGYNYQWTQVSGPNNATMSAPLAVTNNLSGLITGTYTFRLVVTDNDGAGDADWVEVDVGIP